MKNKNNISLEDIGNKLPFSVPDNYFEEFANQIDGQVQIKPVPIIRLLKPWMYMAAMFLALFFIGQIAYNSYENKESDLALVENYDLYVLSQIDENEIVEYYLANEE